MTRKLGWAVSGAVMTPVWGIAFVCARRWRWLRHSPVELFRLPVDSPTVERDEAPAIHDDGPVGATTSPPGSLSPLVPLGQASIAELISEPRPRREVTPAAIACAVVAALGLGFLFRFPITAMFVLPFAGMAVVIAARRRWGMHVASTLFVSAFLAQATSIFVTPFTWWLRFGFFLTLIGAYLLLIVWQTREL